MNIPELLNIDQAAAILGITPRYLRKLMARREIGFIEISAKQSKITPEAISEFIEKKSVPPMKTVVDDSQYSNLKCMLKRNRSLKSKDETVKGICQDRLSQELRDEWRS
jgi:hypothetical protein